MANDLDQAASNAIAGSVSFPVDAIAWLLRKAGLPIDKPVMGSDWMKEKGLTKEVQPGGAQVVGETIGSLVDPLSSLGTASKAMLIGVGSMDPLMVRATELLRKGMPREELWRQLGVEHVPHTTSAVPLNPEVPVAGVREISDLGLRPNKNMLMSYEDKLKHVVSKLSPLQQASAELRAKTTDMFYPGMHRVGDLIDHPELFNSGGNIANLRVKVDPKLQLRGAYNPMARAISLGQGSFLTAPSDGAVSTLLHELTHDTQRRFGMPSGAAVGNFSYTPVIKEHLKARLEALSGSSNIVDAAHAGNVLDTFDKPYSSYKNVLGEQQARATQKRLKLSEGAREEIVPSASYDNLFGAFPAEFVRNLVAKLRSTP